MPFTKQIDRDKVEKYRIDKQEVTKDWAVGDWCYYFYKPMVEQWKANPRWTTAHNIYKEMKTYINYNSAFDQFNTSWKDEICAYELAWQVFFQNYVMPYEKIKEEENGTI